MARSTPTGTPRPQQWLLRLLMGVQACRLPALKPLKPLKPLKRLKPLKPLKLCHSVWDAQPRSLKPLKLCPSVWDAQPRRHKLPQGQIHRFFSARSTPTGTPRPQQWLLRLLMGVQACRLPALKPLKPLKRLKPLKPLKLLKLCHSVWDAQPRSLKPLKLCPSVWDAQPRRHKLPQGQIHRFFSARSMPTGTPRPQQWLLRLLMGVQACRLPAFKPLKPLKFLKPLKLLKLCHSVWDVQSRSLKPLKLCPSVWDVQPRRHKLPQGQIHRFFSARSTPTGTPRPQQWLLRLLMGVQACRLPALKPLKPLKRLKPLKPLKLLKLCHSVWDAQPRSLKPLKLCPSVWDAQPRRHKLPQGQIHRFFSARSMPTGTPRPQQWLLRLLMGVQACRLPAFKPLKPLKPLKFLKPLKLLKLCHSVWDAQSRSFPVFLVPLTIFLHFLSFLSNLFRAVPPLSSVFLLRNLP